MFKGRLMHVCLIVYCYNVGRNNYVRFESENVLTIEKNKLSLTLYFVVLFLNTINNVFLLYFIIYFNGNFETYFHKCISHTDTTFACTFASFLT